jgi:hypothetical protein
MIAEAAQSRKRKWPRILSLIGFVLIGVGLLGFLSTSFSRTATNSLAVNRHSLTVIEEDLRATSAPPDEYTRLTREGFEREKGWIISRERQIGTKIGAGADDGWLWVRTRAALAEVEELDGVKIDVEVDRGVVTLTGAVLDEAQKARAEATAKGVEGVRRVVNKLTVVAGQGDSPDGGAARLTPPGVFFEKAQARKKQAEETKIEIEWPKEMKLTDKGVARISIMAAEPASHTPTAELPNNEALLFDTSRCATPNASLRDAYGAQYEAAAVANLMSPAFNVTPNQTGAKPLGQEKTSFTWGIEPKAGGSHAITLSVSAQWHHKRNKQAKPACEFFNRSFPVVVRESIVSEGNLKWYGGIVVLLGAILQLPIFYGRKGGGKDNGEK